MNLLVWGATGPLFGFSDTWQLVITTGTTIVTCLMVFLIQRSQNKESQAIQLKLNELVAAVAGAREASGWCFIGMPGLEKRLARYAQL